LEFRAFIKLKHYDYKRKMQLAQKQGHEIYVIKCNHVIGEKLIPENWK